MTFFTPEDIICWDICHYALCYVYVFSQLAWLKFYCPVTLDNPLFVCKVCFLFLMAPWPSPLEGIEDLIRLFLILLQHRLSKERHESVCLWHVWWRGKWNEVCFIFCSEQGEQEAEKTVFKSVGRSEVFCRTWLQHPSWLCRFIAARSWSISLIS